MSTFTSFGPIRDPDLSDGYKEMRIIRWTMPPFSIAVFSLRIHDVYPDVLHIRTLLDFSTNVVQQPVPSRNRFVPITRLDGHFKERIDNFTSEVPHRELQPPLCVDTTIFPARQDGSERRVCVL